MKLIFYCCIVISIIAISTSLRTKSKTQTAVKFTEATSNPTQPIISQAISGQELKELWGRIFQSTTQPQCRDEHIRQRLNTTVIPKERNRLHKNFPIPREDLYSKLNIGFGPSAYLFDFLDPLLLKPIIIEFNEIWKDFKTGSVDDPKLKNYTDPYSLEAILVDNLAAKPTQEQLLSKFEKAMPSLKVPLWKDSINCIQLNAGIHRNKWFTFPGVADPGRRLMDRFDFDGDGRLNRYEFIIAMIMNNKSLFGQKICNKCMEKAISEFIDPIYLYMDCDNDSNLLPEEMWKTLSHLKRPVDGYNFYECSARDDNPRTACVNDLVLKGNRSAAGTLSRDEFRLAILIGYWNRQIYPDKIIEDNKKNMKDMRWESNGSKDVACDDFLLFMKK